MAEMLGRGRISADVKRRVRQRDEPGPLKLGINAQEALRAAEELSKRFKALNESTLSRRQEQWP